MITIRKELELKYKPGDKIDGCDYWFSGETFREFMDEFITSDHNFLLKGLPNRNQAIAPIVSAAPIDIIGYVKQYTEDSITVELNVGIINKGLLALIMSDKLKVVPVIIVNNRDQQTHEIYNAKLLAFELAVCPSIQKS